MTAHEVVEPKGPSFPRRVVRGKVLRQQKWKNWLPRFDLASLGSAILALERPKQNMDTRAKPAQDDLRQDYPILSNTRFEHRLTCAQADSSTDDPGPETGLPLALASLRAARLTKAPFILSRGGPERQGELFGPDRRRVDFDVERGERVADGVGDRRRRGDRAAFADAL